MRHRQAHDTATGMSRSRINNLSPPPAEALAADDDPFHLFENPLEDHHHEEDARRSHFRQRLWQRCCSRKSRRLWLCVTWVFLLNVMAVIAWRIMRLLNHTSPDLLVAERNSLASPFLPVTKNLIRGVVLGAGTLAGKHNHNPYHNSRQDDPNKPRMKTILYWNTYWDIPHFQFGEGHQPFLDANCPVSDCIAVQDTPDQSNNYRASFDAVLVHAHDFDMQRLRDIPKWRHSAQHFVYVNMESPLSYPASGDRYLKDFFNWTMTYRLDSDLPRPYGFFEPLSESAKTTTNHQHFFPPIHWQQSPEFLAYKEETFFRQVLPYKSREFYQLAQRPKKVAWIVSRCDSPSRREDYVAELSQYIPVDILGACGDLPCNTSFHNHNQQAQTYSVSTNNDGGVLYSNDDNCTAAVKSDYKFYLAFENSFCNDYATEKFFSRMQGNNALVVVLGGANYTRIAPPHSYVNALDYPSPRALAEKLKELDQNKSLYLSYFWWKDHYTVHTGTPKDYSSSMCRLCEMLHDKALSPKVYPSMSTWHGAESQCWNHLPKVIQDIPHATNDNEDTDGDDGMASF